MLKCQVEGKPIPDPPSLEEGLAVIGKVNLHNMMGQPKSLGDSKGGYNNISNRPETKKQKSSWSWSMGGMTSMFGKVLDKTTSIAKNVSSFGPILIHSNRLQSGPTIWYRIQIRLSIMSRQAWVRHMMEPKR